jgi:protein involved in polysaccharide export with SLBB domain
MRSAVDRVRPRNGSPGHAALCSWLVLLLAGLVAGCGGHPQPMPLPTPGEEAPPPEAEYRLRPGDELNVMVVGQPEFTQIVKVRPDGRLTAPGMGEFDAAGRTIPEVTEEIRSGLRRLVRHPEVSVLLTAHATELVYVFGEVKTPGAHPYLANMTALHALGAAGGQKDTGKMNRVLVLRRTGPNSLDVYPLDLGKTLSADGGGRDVYLRPYDVVYVPRTFIGNLNAFVDKWVRQNIAPFTAYIEGWRAFHASDVFVSVRAVAP